MLPGWERTGRVPGDFDVVALWEAVEVQRAERDMSWTAVANSFAWMSKSTIDRMHETGNATCNHVLPMIQWVGRTPESFTVEPDGAVHELLPDPGGRWRWWWNHRDLAESIDVRREERDLSWQQVADEMGVGVAEVRGVKKLRYGPRIGFAMIAARWLGRPAAGFLTESPPQTLN
jgi:hypothetical protein